MTYVIRPVRAGGVLLSEGVTQRGEGWDGGGGDADEWGGD